MNYIISSKYILLQHMMNIYQTYNTQAEQANVLIIPGCGFASVPVSAGLIHLENNFKGVHLKAIHIISIMLFLNVRFI